MKRYFVLLVLTLFVIASSAYASDPFTVKNVKVDATADTAIDAQLKATEAGQIRAAEILIERLTLESQRAELGLPEVTIDMARSIIRGQSIANEKRSSRRYLANITVAFNPSRVKAKLESAGYKMIATQSRPRLILPIFNDDNPWNENEWTTAWRNEAFMHSLTPVKYVNDDTVGMITANEVLSLNKPALQRVAQQFGVAQILIAQASGSEGNISVTLTDYSVDTQQRRSMGTVRASNFDGAAWSVVSKLENDWKQASVSLAENAKDMSVTVLYASQSDWMQLQDVINNSAQIQEARLDALSKDGAMMTLSFSGNINRLSNELAYKGVQINTDPGIGTYIAKNNYRR